MPEPYYQDDAVTIYHGDCRELLVGLEADVMVTDPPYGTDYYEHDTDVGAFVASLVPQFQTAAVFGFPERLVAWCVGHDLNPDEWVTWWPTNKAAGHRSKGLVRETEHIAVFGPLPGARALMQPRTGVGRVTGAITSARGLSVDERRAGDVWRDPAPGMAFLSHLRLHPNEKPLSLMQKLVLVCSSRDQTILDPFAGSGTTLLAAKNLGRRAIGVEIDEAHCETAVGRMGQQLLDLGAA